MRPKWSKSLFLRSHHQTKNPQLAKFVIPSYESYSLMLLGKPCFPHQRFILLLNSNLKNSFHNPIKNPSLTEVIAPLPIAFTSSSMFNIYGLLFFLWKRFNWSKLLLARFAIPMKGFSSKISHSFIICIIYKKCIIIHIWNIHLLNFKYLTQ